MMVDTKNGDSYDGVMVGIDSFMNVKLKDVIITSAGEPFFISPEGTSIEITALLNELILLN